MHESFFQASLLSNFALSLDETTNELKWAKLPSGDESGGFRFEGSLITLSKLMF